MKTRAPTNPRLLLAADTAEQLMTPNPMSIGADATVREAVALMTDHGFNAAPVIDRAGRPVGVVSSTDILVHDREHARHAELEDQTDWDVPPRQRGYSVEVVDPTRVRDIMTPTVFTASLDTPAREVVKRMLALRVHRLFVVDEDNVLVGVISPLDVLRRLRPETE